MIQRVPDFLITTTISLSYNNLPVSDLEWWEEMFKNAHIQEDKIKLCYRYRTLPKFLFTILPPTKQMSWLESISYIRFFYFQDFLIKKQALHNLFLSH